MNDEEFKDIIDAIANDADMDIQLKVAFPAEAAAEDAESADVHGETCDRAAENDHEATPAEVEREAHDEDDFLETLPLPGIPEGEAARRKAWLGIPRKARLLSARCTMSLVIALRAS